MFEDDVSGLEWISGIGEVDATAKQTRAYMSSAPGARLAAQLSNHLWAYNATADLIPYFGDARLAYTEAYFQLKNSVSLAYHGFYSQAFSTLRSVCELSLLQASLPEGEVMTDRKYDLIRPMLPPDLDFPGKDAVNWVFPPGFGATQSPEREATTLEEWATDGCRTPKSQKMLKQLLESDAAKRFDVEARLSDRLCAALRGLDPYVHARGRLRCASELSNGNVLGFSEETLSQYGTQMMFATQVSLAVLLIAFLPTRTTHPDAAAGFIDYRDLHRVLDVLPSKEADLFRAIYEGSHG